MTPLLSRITEDSEVKTFALYIFFLVCCMIQGSRSPLTDDLEPCSPKMGTSKKTSQDHLACEEGPGICALLMTITSLILIVVSLPLSLFLVVKVVQVPIKIKSFYAKLVGEDGRRLFVWSTHLRQSLPKLCC